MNTYDLHLSLDPARDGTVYSSLSSDGLRVAALIRLCTTVLFQKDFDFRLNRDSKN